MEAKPWEKSKRVKKKKNRKKGYSLEKIGWDGKDLNILRGNRKRRKWENTQMLDLYLWQ